MSLSHPKKSLQKILEINAEDFITTISEVRRLLTIVGQELPDADETLDYPLRLNIGVTVEQMAKQMSMLGSQSAWVAANRLAIRLRDENTSINVHGLRHQLTDVESRFTDHLEFIRLFVLYGEQVQLLQPAADLLEEPTASHFTSIWFDCEEAAKSLCVQRPTASVFHSMRMLEIGIRAFAARLKIPDPVTPAQRNWAIMLKSIKAKIDADYPAKERKSGSEGAFLESLYATLDAVKNPWRNEVMHVEGVYADTEARFILLCVIGFIKKMASSFDENGEAVPPPTLLLSEPDQ